MRYLHFLDYLMQLVEKLDVIGSNCQYFNCIAVVFLLLWQYKSKI